MKYVEYKLNEKTYEVDKVDGEKGLIYLFFGETIKERESVPVRIEDVKKL